MMKVNMIPQYDTMYFTQVFDDAGTFVYYYNHVGIPKTISDNNARTLYYLLYARYGNTPIANYDPEQFKYKIFSIVFQYGPTWEKRLSVQQTLRDMQLADLVDNGAIAELFNSQGTSSQTSSGTNGNTRTLNTQEANTGTATTTKTGTQTLGRAGTDTVASTGTSGLAHTGTVRTQGDSEDIKNHAYNPSSAPATDAYSPLGYINEQQATKNDVDNTVTYNNTDTTTNNLQNQTTHNTTDTTTNNLTDQLTNNLNRADTGTITDAGSSSGTVSGNESRNNSTTTTMTAGKLKAYEKLLELLDTDVTGEFISKFKTCFKQFVLPEHTYIYVSEDDDYEE